MKKILLKMPVLSALFLSLVLASSCSSLIKKDDCKKDMAHLGLEHGRRGMSSLSDEIRKVCINSTETVDLEAYQKGFTVGWSDFCTPFRGFTMGVSGDVYKSYCPAEKEALFREKFIIGKTVYEKKDQVTELEAKIKNLAGTSSFKDELKKYENDLLLLNREIQALEQQGKSLIHTN